MKTVYMLVGNIGSGKSTWCNKFVEYSYHHKVDYIVEDGIRIDLGDGQYIYNKILEPIIKLHCLTGFELLLNKPSTDAIIIDETNMALTSRSKYIDCIHTFNLYSEEKACIIAVVFPIIEKDIAVDRRMCCSSNFERQYWEDVWDYKSNRYQSPTTEEGFNEVWNLTLPEIGL